MASLIGSAKYGDGRILATINFEISGVPCVSQAIVPEVLYNVIVDLLKQDKDLRIYPRTSNTTGKKYTEYYGQSLSSADILRQLSGAADRKKINAFETLFGSEFNTSDNFIFRIITELSGIDRSGVCKDYLRRKALKPDQQVDDRAYNDMIYGPISVDDLADPVGAYDGPDFDDPRELKNSRDADISQAVRAVPTATLPSTQSKITLSLRPEKQSPMKVRPGVKMTTRFGTHISAQAPSDLETNRAFFDMGNVRDSEDDFHIKKGKKRETRQLIDKVVSSSESGYEPGSEDEDDTR